MNLPQIRMESQFAKIGLQIDKPVQSIEQPPADLSIEQPRADLSIRQPHGKLNIDQTQAWEDMNIKTPSRFAEQIAQEGYNAWLSAVGRIAEQGDELMRIENGGDPLVSQAIVNGAIPTYDFNIGWIPSAFSVKLNFEPGKLEINAQPNKPIIKATPNKPIHQYTPGKVNVYMQQFNSLKIDFINLTV